MGGRSKIYQTLWQRVVFYPRNQPKQPGFYSFSRWFNFKWPFHPLLWLEVVSQVLDFGSRVFSTTTKKVTTQWRAISVLFPVTLGAAIGWSPGWRGYFRTTSRELFGTPFESSKSPIGTWISQEVRINGWAAPPRNTPFISRFFTNPLIPESTKKPIAARWKDAGSPVFWGEQEKNNQNGNHLF